MLHMTTQDATEVRPLATLADIARLTGRTYRTVLKWQAEGRLPPRAKNVPGYPRWTWESLEAWVREQ